VAYRIRTGGAAEGHDVCDATIAAGSVAEAEQRFRELREAKSDTAEATPIDFRASHLNRRAGTPCPRTDCAIFFGGQLDGRDTFVTPVGIRSGVAVHAAIFHSIGQHGGWHISEAIMEILGGTILGTILARVWSLHADWSGDAIRASGIRGLATWGVTRGLASAAVLVTVFAFVTMLLISSKLLTWGVWISPAPLAVGVLIDSMAAVRRPEVPSNAVRSVAVRLDFWSQVALWVVAGLVLLGGK
jgi:hypothetical protein